MHNLLSITLFFLFITPATKSTSPESKADLLAGSTQKSWHLAARTPEPAEASCRTASAHSQDNTWTFYTNGTFTYDNGSITEDSTCDGPGCCSDLANLEGSWQLKSAGEDLVITALRLRESPEAIDPVVLIDASILVLEEDRLRLSQKHPETGIETIFEFRTR